MVRGSIFDLIAEDPERGAFIVQTKVQRGPTRYVLSAWSSWAGVGILD
jgi:hypothetical protein